MKTFYSEAKYQISSCMQHDSSETPNTDMSRNINQRSDSCTSNDSNNSDSDEYDNQYSTHMPPNNNKHFDVPCTQEILETPFKYDKSRGHWSTTSDFYFACTSYACGSHQFSEVPAYVLMFCGVWSVPAFLFAIVLCFIPIFLIQTFLGQFSGSGLVSAFRIIPIFKGIGYGMLVTNLLSLTYYTVLVSLPLIYAVNSFHSVLPWMSCQNVWNTFNCSNHTNYDVHVRITVLCIAMDLKPHSTVEFFRYLVRINDENLALSWPLVIGVLGIWLLTLSIVVMRVCFIGRLLRCLCTLMFCIFIITFMNVLVNGNITWTELIGYAEPTLPNTEAVSRSLPAAFVMASVMLGPGWGNVITLASHNHFRRDSEKLTYSVACTYLVLGLLVAVLGRMAVDHFEDHVGLMHFHVEEDHSLQFIYLCYAYLFGSFSYAPNFWSLLFFTMIFLAELSAVIIQTISFLTAIFDEYEYLRSKRTHITVAIVVFLTITSLYFCTNQGFQHLNAFYFLKTHMHLVIWILMVMIITWLYGRERFQCDLQFMLGKTISNFKMFLLRFISPTILCFCFIPVMLWIEDVEVSDSLEFVNYCIAYTCIPAYMAYKLWRTTGNFRSRLIQCIKPLDWHPMDGENRRFYNEVMGFPELQLMHDTRDGHSQSSP